MFNLVDEPWVPVRPRQGSVVELSLRDVYRRAPELEGLALPFALEYVAMTRILVAVLQSALGGPSGINEKLRWLGGHGSCADAVDAYLATWHHRFDLFDGERPFMQQPIGDEVGLAPIAALRADWASGRNAAVFDHRSDARPTPVQPPMAARALLATLLYQPGGGVSKPFNRTDSPATKGVMVLVDGETLWETLVANAPTPGAGDVARPTWERETDHVPDRDGTTPLGWLDRVTWRSRAVQLRRDPDGAVRTCRIHQHLKGAEGPPADPYTPVRRREGEPPALIRPSRSKALWREADALLRGLAETPERRTVAADAAELFDRLDPPRFPQVRVVGQVVEQAKIADVHNATLPVSSALLADEDRLLLVGILVDRAEVGAKALRFAIKTYADALGDGDGWGFANRWEVPFWAALAAPFRASVGRIATAADPPLPDDESVVIWLTAVRAEARWAFAALEAQGVGPRQVRALALSKHKLEAGLSKVTPRKEESL